MPEKLRFGRPRIPSMEETKSHIIAEIILGVMGFALLVTTVIILVNS
jgi:hypothetical protein